MALWIISAIAAALVGAARGRPLAGYLAGLCLGPLGVLVAIVLPRHCPHCSRRPFADACPYCHKPSPI